MRKFGDNMVVFDFLETYHEIGSYEFKIVLDKHRFKTGESAEIEMFDPDNNVMPIDVNKWGRKLNCSFDIDDKMSEGVCTIKIKMVDNRGKEINEMLKCWVIK